MNPKQTYAGRKFAVVSHILPPAPSGQSVLLRRLLRGMAPESYCLIHTGRPGVPPAEAGLFGKCHQLRRPLRLPVLKIPVVSSSLSMLNALAGVSIRARQIASLVRSEGCDLLIGCTGDLYDLPATWLASRWTGIPFVAYIMDDYIFQWTGFSRWIARQLEPQFVKAAAGVLVLNEFVRQTYARRYGIRPFVIHNPVHLPDLDQLDGEAATASLSPEVTQIVYLGSVYHAQFDAFRNLIEALARFETGRVQLHIYTSQPRQFLQKHGISGPDLVYHAHIPQEEIPGVLRRANVLFLPLAFNSPIPELIRTSAPFKTSEYLAAGRPILVHVPAGSFLSWYFRKHSCGMVVDSDDAQLLGDALEKLLADGSLRDELSTKARRQAELDFDLHVGRARFLAALNRAVAEGGD